MEPWLASICTKLNSSKENWKTIQYIKVKGTFGDKALLVLRGRFTKKDTGRESDNASSSAMRCRFNSEDTGASSHKETLSSMTMKNI